MTVETIQSEPQEVLFKLCTDFRGQQYLEYHIDVALPVLGETRRLPMQLPLITDIGDRVAKLLAMYEEAAAQLAAARADIVKLEKRVEVLDQRKKREQQLG